MPDITLRQLRYFAVLARALQYRRAAAQLGISQPSLSLQIAALEQAIGARLVERKRNGLILTPEGREVAARIETILQEVEGLARIAPTAKTELSGTLRLGASPTVGPYLLPRVLRHLHLSHPDLKLIIQDAPPRDLTEDLVAGRHDMILTQLPVGGEELHSQPLFREPLLLSVAADHPLAGQDSARASDLEGQDMLTLHAAFTLHHQVAGLCLSAGATLRDDFEGTSLDAVRQMVSLGMGVTLLPALYVRSEVRQSGAEVAVLPLRPALMRHVGLVWRRASGQPPAFLRLAELIRTVVAQDFASDVTLSA